MTTIAITTKQRKTWHLPEWALVLGFSVGGLIVSLGLAATTWTDAPAAWF